MVGNYLRFILIFLFSLACESKEPYLKLSPIFTADFPFYPGQEAYIGYRYEYNTSIDLIEEELPLLRAEGFKKIGEKQIDHSETKGITTTQVIQKVQAVKPGRYEFPASIVRGASYTIDRLGNKVKGKILAAKVSPLNFIVSSFPEQGRPPSFNGAIGDFKVDAQLEGTSTIPFGGRISLRLIVTGKGEFDSVKLPELCCQPGFAGFFKFSELPPNIEEKEGEKSFSFDLFANEERIQAVPAIEFSSFDPQSLSYRIDKTKEIPIQVLRRNLPQLPTPPSTQIDQVSLPKPFQFESAAWHIPVMPFIFLMLASLILYVHLRYLAEAEKILNAPLEEEQLLLDAEKKRSYQILLQALKKMLQDKGSSKELLKLIQLVERKVYYEKETRFDPTLISEAKRLLYV